MELPVDILSKLDIVNLLAMLAMFWVFKNHLDKKFTKIDEKFDKLEVKFDDRLNRMEVKLTDHMDKMEEKFEHRFDKLDEKVTDVDRRLCRLEGAFATKDCCALKEERKNSRMAE